MSAKTLDKLIKLDPTKGTKQNSDKISKTKNFHFSYVSFFHRSHRAPSLSLGHGTVQCHAMACGALRSPTWMQFAPMCSAVFQWVLSPVGVFWIPLEKCLVRHSNPIRTFNAKALNPPTWKELNLYLNQVWENSVRGLRQNMSRLKVLLQWCVWMKRFKLASRHWLFQLYGSWQVFFPETRRKNLSTYYVESSNMELSFTEGESHYSSLTWTNLMFGLPY